jgi:hypothetical protein
MGQTQRVSGRATAVFTDQNGTHVLYHNTRVVMNQASKQYGLGFQVYQENGEWFVRTPPTGAGVVHRFRPEDSDEVSFNRKTSRRSA